MYNREIGEFHLKNQKNFINYISREEVSGSFIFIGQDSIGKKDFACLVSEIILENNEKIIKDIHPDLYLVDVETEQIVVDDITKLESWVFNKPFEAKKKIVIIRSAEKMNLIAQNKLLKILEEPPDYLFFFLLTSNSSMLLPTVESRCIKMNLESLPESIVEKSLEGRFGDKDLLDIGLFLLDGSHDYENFYTESFLIDIINFLKVIIVKDTSSIDQTIDYIDMFFKVKSEQTKVVNSLIRLLSLLLILKHKEQKENKYFSDVLLNEVSSYNITILINLLENLNINLKGTSLNLKIGFEELILDFILDNDSSNVG